MTIGLDASAVIAMVLAERDGERVAARLDEAWIGSVNLAEVAAVLVDKPADGADEMPSLVNQGLGLTTARFDAVQAGRSRAATRQKGLPLGDRACLALSLGAPVLTADRVWADLDVGVEIEVAR